LAEQSWGVCNVGDWRQDRNARPCLSQSPPALTISRRRNDDCRPDDRYLIHNGRKAVNRLFFRYLIAGAADILR